MGAELGAFGPPPLPLISSGRSGRSQLPRAAVARVGLASAGAGARFSVCTLARTGHAAPPERLTNDAAVRRRPIATSAHRRRGRSPAVRGAWSAIHSLLEL